MATQISTTIKTIIDVLKNAFKNPQPPITPPAPLIVIGAEFSLAKNLYLRAGYNYRRRQEMIIDSKTSTVGFSWGFGVKISKFHFSYGRSKYHLAGSPNFFSISTNLESFNRNL